ncbi:hypothetical protein, partial [Mycobacterium marinum]|uniref:hypothetical protein n=1 Tax=Mycobacterium marinum TaxID=1781 RepID=UPI003BB062A2
NSIVLNPPVPALRPQRRVTKNHQRRSQACKSTTPEPCNIAEACRVTALTADRRLDLLNPQFPSSRAG